MMMLEKRTLHDVVDFGVAASAVQLAIRSQTWQPRYLGANIEFRTPPPKASLTLPDAARKFRYTI